MKQQLEVFAAGVTFASLCGPNRQDIINECVGGEAIKLVRQPSNPHDANAILLTLDDGRDIGFVPRDTAEDLAPQIDGGAKVSAEITYIDDVETDDGEDGYLSPCIEITLAPTAPPEADTSR